VWGQAQPRPLRGGHGSGQDPLDRQDLREVQIALWEIAPTWSAELNCANPDESTIVILPPGASDLLGPAFVLHRTNGRVHLDQFRWDEYRKLGAFHGLEDALRELRARLAPLASLMRRERDG